MPCGLSTGQLEMLYRLALDGDRGEKERKEIWLVYHSFNSKTFKSDLEA